MKYENRFFTPIIKKLNIRTKNLNKSGYVPQSEFIKRGLEIRAKRMSGANMVQTVDS